MDKDLEITRLKHKIKILNKALDLKEELNENLRKEIDLLKEQGYTFDEYKLIDFILSNHSQVIIEGRYAISALHTYGKGETLKEACQNWQEKYNKNIDNPEWVNLYCMQEFSKHLEQF